MHAFNASLKLWLAAQCQILGNVQGAILVQTSTDSLRVLAKWPASDSRDEALLAVSSAALQKQRLHLAAEQHGHLLLGQPLIIDGNCWGVLALDLTNADKKSMPALLKELKSGQFWLQYMIHQQAAINAAPVVAPPLDALGNEQQQAALLELIAKLLKEHSLAEMALSLVNILATHLQAVRVSCGLLVNSKIKLEAVSFAASVDMRTQTISAIAEAMSEALEQGVSLDFSLADLNPAASGSHITRAQQQLLQLQQLQSVHTLLLRQGDSLLGAICIESDKHPLLTNEQQVFLQSGLHFIGAIVALRQQAEASVRRTIGARMARQLQRWLGPANWRGKLLGGALLALLASLFMPLQYRIAADATVQTTARHLVVSPQDGYLGKVLVRPGDSVKQAAPLAYLKDEDLRLERRKLASQEQQYRQAYDAALANADRVAAAIANAQMEQASIQLRLIDLQLARAQLSAPIDGIIVSDDIAQNQGAPVKQGDILFELAAANQFVVQLFVDERDIAAVGLGQPVQVKLTSLPGSVFAARVKTLTPISEVRDGRNYFRVELELQEVSLAAAAHSLLRPGMTGTGKIAVGQRALGWIWLHDIWHWLRLSLW